MREGLSTKPVGVMTADRHLTSDRHVSIRNGPPGRVVAQGHPRRSPVWIPHRDPPLQCSLPGPVPPEQSRSILKGTLDCQWQESTCQEQIRTPRNLSSINFHVFSTYRSIVSGYTQMTIKKLHLKNGGRWTSKLRVLSFPYTPATVYHKKLRMHLPLYRAVCLSSLSTYYPYISTMSTYHRPNRPPPHEASNAKRTGPKAATCAWR